MGWSTDMFILLLALNCADAGQDRPLRPGDYSDGNPMRASVGAQCWYPNYYCSVTEDNTQTPVVVTGGADTCYDKCKEDSNCHFFTWFERRGVEYCYMLTECGTDHQIKDDWCLQRGTCFSGPKDCSPVQTNGVCTLVDTTSHKTEWQCENGGTGLNVNGYNGTLNPGARCMLSCASWESFRWANKSGVTYPVLKKGFLFSTCQGNGSWSDVLPNDFKDSRTSLNWPAPDQLQLTAYPKPDVGSISCDCRDLVLVWPPLQPKFYYNPRYEAGATMECEDEVENSEVASTQEFRITSKNTCRFLCDDYLVATVKCVHGEWTGEKDKGFWCYEDPKEDNMLKSYSITNQTKPNQTKTTDVLFIAGGEISGWPDKISDVEVLGNNCNVPDLPSPTKGLIVEYYNGDILACGGYTSGGSTPLCYSLQTSGWVEHSNMGVGRTLASAVITNSNALYVLGGFGSSVSSSHSSVYLTPGNNTWLAGPVIPGNGVGQSCAVGLGNGFLVIGGSLGSKTQVLEYDGSAWTNWTPLTVGRNGHSCVEYGSQIVIAGGQVSGSGYSASTVIINTLTKTNTDGPDMAVARYGLAFKNVNNKMLAVGGYDGNGYLASGETFDVSLGGELSGMNMTVVRASLGATVVPKSVLASMFGCT